MSGSPTPPEARRRTAGSERIQVVVADDSPFVCRLLTSYLEASREVEVVGTADDGRRAVTLVRQLRPQVATLDLDMPGLDGLGALEQIMRETPTPVVMISGVSGRAARKTLTALDLGAVDFVLKYNPDGRLDPTALRGEILAKVRAASKIRVIRSLRSLEEQWQAPPAAGGTAAAAAELPQALPAAASLPAGVVVIGSSTGGPVALKELLGNLPADFPAPLVVVQHMPATFTGVLAAQLDRHVSLRVREARDGDPLEPGTALVAPGGYHLLFRPDARVALKRGPEIAGHCPSIDVTMQAAAQVFGSRTRGVLLTGMGDDGAMGMVSIRSRGGRNFAQDAETCVVAGMPQRAVDRGVVDHVAPPGQLARLLAMELPARRRRKAC
jgi:two-component system, chemotaxis family, protein-glutamate methylesterase/glutaminase